MILETVERNVRMSGMGEFSEITISKNDAPLIASFLTDRLYSDKIGAIIREYIANAVDANIVSGSKNPIRITVPSKFQPTFSIRDNGFGLSPKEIKDRFNGLGASDKREEMELIGAFGLGCKSGYCYADSFNITSWHNGVVTYYTAQKVKNGRMGIITISSEPSSEPSGLEVSFSIRENDIEDFNKKLIKFLKYLSLNPKVVKPEIVGSLVVPEIKYLLKSEKFFVEEREYTYGNTNLCIMGSVAYPLDVSMLGEKFRSLRNVVVLAGLGEVEVPPSRESLEYTEKTIDFLNGVFSEIEDTLKTDTQNTINQKTKIWEVYETIKAANTAFGSLFNLYAKDFFFNGRSMPETHKEICHYSIGKGNKWWFSKPSYSPQCISDRSVLIKADPLTTRIFIKRFVQGVSDKLGFIPKEVIVSNDPTVYDFLFCDTWNENQIITDFKSFYAAPEKKVKKSCDNVIVYYKKMRRHSSMLSTITTNKYYITHCGRYPAKHYNRTTVHTIADELEIPFYSIAETDVKYLDSSWTPLEEIVVKKVNELLTQSTNKANYARMKFNAIGESLTNVITDFATAFNNCGDQSAVESYKTLGKLAIANENSAIRYARMMNITIDENADVEVDNMSTLIHTFIKKYELVVNAYCVGSWNISGSFKNSLEKYIYFLNGVDKEAVKV